MRSHVMMEAYRTGIITRDVLRTCRRLLLLPGREYNWLHCIEGICRRKSYKILPDLRIITQLHPPINDLMITHLGLQQRPNLKFEEYVQLVRLVYKQWVDQGRPRPEPQRVGNTLISIKSWKGGLALEFLGKQGPIHYVGRSDLVVGSTRLRKPRPLNQKK